MLFGLFFVPVNGHAKLAPQLLFLGPPPIFFLLEYISFKIQNFELNSGRFWDFLNHLALCNY